MSDELQAQSDTRKLISKLTWLLLLMAPFRRRHLSKDIGVCVCARVCVCVCVVVGMCEEKQTKAAINYYSFQHKVRILNKSLTYPFLFSHIKVSAFADRI